MADSLATQLLSQARRLARLDSRRPKQGNLRRAVSTAYYALFHFLVDQSSRCVFGTANDRRPFRYVLARAFEHSAMLKACKSFANGTLPAKIQSALPATFGVALEVRAIARTFVAAQETRHEADYDLSVSFTRADVLALIENIAQAISTFNAVLADVETKFFLACLLAWGSLRN